MKRKILITASTLILIIGSAIYLLIYRTGKEIHDLEIQSQYLIQKVESYKKQHRKLPQYEDDMNLNLPDDYPISYAITHDSTVYVVGFQFAPFRSMLYHSDTKTWISQ